MAQNANKTEHSGAKKGRGAYWGRKKDAKEESRKKRRINERQQLKDGEAFCLVENEQPEVFLHKINDQN